ncbi:type I-G CRISPR-associated protein Csb2 [Corynebacterium flavescens]
MKTDTHLSVIARFPLGVYIGHRPDGSLDFAPSPARLHSALLNAAAQGTRGEDGQPSAESLHALEWLEQNPPDALFQPESMIAGTTSSRFMYRKVGTLAKSKGGKYQPATEKRRVSDGVSVSSGFGYRWDSVPTEVAETIRGLLEDVSCLGETHSLAVLEVADFTPNLTRDDAAGAFTPGTQEREVAAPGRTQKLISEHNQQFKKKAPHKFSFSARPHSYIPSRESVRRVRYRSSSPRHEAVTPWAEVYFFEVDKEIPAKHYVELCSTMHKALISRNGNDVSPVITGKYLSGTKQKPANRLAIQYLPRNISRILGFDSPVLALFVPRGTSGADLQQIHAAEKIDQLWSRKLGRLRIRFTATTRFADQFWPSPEPGYKRLWKPMIPIIPETRPVRLKDETWGLADSGLLSLAYVWRDELSSTEKGQRRYIELRNQVLSRGASVSYAKTSPVRARDFVHRTHNSVPVQPYTAIFQLGSLADSQTAVMIGQSRHLGGGLLVPFDVPEKELESI